MPLFQTSVLKNYLSQQDHDAVAKAYRRYSKYFLDSRIQENIRSSKEEQFQASFLTELFVKVLGYTMNPSPDYNLTTEYKNEKNNRKADGAILNNGKTLAVVELKGTNTKDLKSIRRQAFYQNYSRFKRELFRDLVKRNAKNIREARQEELKEVKTEQAYQLELQSLAKNVKLALFKKSQKLIDRFLFIFFAEDRGLLTPNSTLEISQKWKADIDFGDERPLYNLFKFSLYQLAFHLQKIKDQLIYLRDFGPVGVV